MGLLKWLCALFKCESKCIFNVDSLPDDMLDIDLSQYTLKEKDYKAIYKIMLKRPSIMTHKHPAKRKIYITEL
tara:strand:+ start:910 stop:1128 length:219 start_codon:yes stop_codon:yes gene_type:complete